MPDTLVGLYGRRNWDGRETEIRHRKRVDPCLHDGLGPPM